MTNEIALEGKIEKVIELLQIYLQGLSNRDYCEFDEKYIKLIFYCIAMNLSFYRIKSEMEVGRRYPDLVCIPKKESEKYYGVIIEFKYLKKEEEHMLQEKQAEAKKQLQEYSRMEEIASMPKMKKYTIVAVNDKLYVEEI